MQCYFAVLTQVKIRLNWWSLKMSLKTLSIRRANSLMQSDASLECMLSGLQEEACQPSSPCHSATWTLLASNSAKEGTNS